MFKWLVTRSAGLGSIELAADYCLVRGEGELVFTCNKQVPVHHVSYADDVDRERGYCYKDIVVLALAEGEWRRVDLFE